MTIDLGSPDLVNTTALFEKIVRRLFTANPEEVLAELLQNSQRAGASRVEISFPDPTHCTIRDDGCGIDGYQGLSTLLSIGSSSYPDPRVALHQSPMGLGLYALLSLEGIESVEVQSRGISFTVDVPRWFTDEGYRGSWRERAYKQAPATDQRGLSLYIEANSILIEEFRSLMRGEKFAPYYGKVLSPACGYADLLEVTLDGQPVDATLPKNISLATLADVEDAYKGNLIRIQRDRDLRYPSGKLYCNWYGQIISTQVNCPWTAYLEVRTGNPVTPIAPTRRHLISDSLLDELKLWIETRIFTLICTLDAPNADEIEYLYHLNRKRAQLECPFALVQWWRGLPDKRQNIRYLDDVLTHAQEPVVVVGKSDPLFLLRDSVMVQLPGSHILHSDKIRTDPQRANELVPVLFHYGLESFIEATGLHAYRAIEGVEAHHSLWWRPGPNSDDYYTTHLGSYGIGKDDKEPEVWWPLPRGNVFVFDEVSCWDPEDVDMLIGLERTQDIVPFLQRFGNVFFLPDGESPERSREVYKENIAAMARSYLDNALDGEPLADLLCEIARCAQREGQVSDLSFEESPSGQPGGQVRVRWRDGEVREFNVYNHFRR